MMTVLAVRTTSRGTWREMFGGMGAYAKVREWVLQPVDARAQRPDFAAIAAYWGARGWIIDASGGAANLRGADFAGLPAVAINPDERIGDGIPEIGNDQREVARLAMGDLMRRDPATLVFAEWFQRRDWVLRRMDEARRVAAMHGRTLRAISPCGYDGSGDRGVAAVERLTAALKPLERPIGVFAAADDIGALVIAAASRLGLSVPDDIAVVGVDNDPEICENCTPTLTSVRPDYRALGFTAAKTLARLLDAAGRKLGTLAGDMATVVPLAGLVRRASSTTLQPCDRRVADALECIRLGACDGLTVAQVVRKCFGTSMHTAEDRFKAATGHTIGEEILKRRLAAALEYLREGRSSIGAIANFCGWNSAAAFRKVFTARHGLSPKNWKGMKI